MLLQFSSQATHALYNPHESKTGLDYTNNPPPAPPRFTPIEAT